MVCARAQFACPHAGTQSGALRGQNTKPSLQCGMSARHAWKFERALCADLNDAGRFVLTILAPTTLGDGQILLETARVEP